MSYCTAPFCIWRSWGGCCDAGCVQYQIPLMVLMRRGCSLYLWLCVILSKHSWGPSWCVGLQVSLPWQIRAKLAWRALPLPLQLQLQRLQRVQGRVSLWDMIGVCLLSRRNSHSLLTLMATLFFKHKSLHYIKIQMWAMYILFSLGEGV